MKKREWVVSLRIVADYGTENALSLVDELQYVTTSLPKVFRDVVKVIDAEVANPLQYVHEPREGHQTVLVNQLHFHVTISEVNDNGEEIAKAREWTTIRLDPVGKPTEGPAAGPSQSASSGL